MDLVTTDSGIPAAMQRLTAEIQGQFALTYVSPTQPDAGSRLRVTVNKPDVTVRAPERVY